MVIRLFIIAVFSWSIGARAQSFVIDKNAPGAFTIVGAAIYVSPQDDWLVHQSATLLQHDIQMVTGRMPEIISTMPPSGNVIIIGTVQGCTWIDSLAAAHRLDIDSIKGKWEVFTISTLDGPALVPGGPAHALIIAGSDKRGAAYGVFELSRQMGVSPWYWWADVPPKQHKEVFFKQGVYRYGSPSVKYRGIFINDEAPAFSGWTKEKFGGVNHLVYEKIFELLLRLKANYLWPAMWGNAFNDDDTLNPVLADKWGIVMGTSHHEPMLRAQQEWKRYGRGLWDYTTNDSVLRAFWKKGIENMGRHESIITIGMRGDGDKPMTEGTATQLLENIVTDQRKIISSVTGKPASQTPQLWALYKEVQDYYDKGMRVPDDVILLLCDDNWGNIRRLPKLTDPPRTGGYGIYYHFDYVGDPRNYKWLNTNNIARVWEQMHLAYDYGVRQIWIVNVGDLKPMEFPISFFLDYAWNAGGYNAGNLPDYFTSWAAEQFGPEHAAAIGRIIQKYSQYNARRKPELLDAQTYNIDEALRITQDWDTLLHQAEKINGALPAEYKDAYFQLVLHPVKACSNLQHLYTAVALNRKYVQENNPAANIYAEEAKQYYLRDSIISSQYNHLAGGKWDHMMDQTHIGYTYWQQPDRQKMPAVTYVPEDTSATTSIQVSLPNSPTHRIQAPVPANAAPNTFYELNGYLSIQASHATRQATAPGIHWQVIPGIGRDGDGITTFPVTMPMQLLGSGSPRLEYDIYTYDTGAFKLHAYFSPTLNIHHDSAGLQYAIAIDDQQPQIVSINKGENNPHVWGQWVADDIIIITSTHSIHGPGRHILKYWPLSPAIILQKIVLDCGGLQPSYLGPRETITLLTAALQRPAQTPTLKEAFKNDFLIGMAINTRQIEEKDPAAARLIPQQFNALTPENIMKAEIIHPGWDQYNFDIADKLVAYAQKNNIKVNAHNLIWHSQLPGYVHRINNADSLRTWFAGHITTIASRYDGKVYSWDVVNEALNEDGTLRNSIFLEKLGPNYLVEAFRLAQKAAPHTKLYYNDYNIEQPKKRAGAIALIKKIQAAGVRIDGVGIQGHWRAGNVPMADIEASIREFSALGIEVMFTELDLGVLPNPWDNTIADVGQTAASRAGMNPYSSGLPDSVSGIQAKAYADLFRLFLKYKGKVSRITFWGLDDGMSWLNDWPIRGRTNYPLLFDRNYQPKEAYFKVIATKQQP